MELTLITDEAFRAPAENMAMDELLLASASSPVLRVYRWEAPAATFGYAQRWAEVEALIGALPHTRRRTGGGIVLHGNDWTYALILPRGNQLAPRKPLDTYHWLHERLAAALEHGAGSLWLATCEETRSGRECFNAPAVGDVMGPTGKVAGAAIHRGRAGMLIQGSVRVADPEFAPRFAEALSPHFSSDRLSWEIVNQARLLARDQYAADAWIRDRQHNLRESLTLPLAS